MKPLGYKNYGSIGHFPSSRVGPGDWHIHEGQERICTTKARDKHDVIIITEKLDGSNVGIAKHEGKILAIVRAGYLAVSSKYEMHHHFAEWVRQREDRFQSALQDGERIAGEWLLQAHGSKYAITNPEKLFVAFDLFKGQQRTLFSQLRQLATTHSIAHVKPIHEGGPLPIEDALKLLGNGSFGVDEPEGVVYRVERQGKFDFMGKFVHHSKVDGKYLVKDGEQLPALWNYPIDKLTTPTNP